MTDTRGTTLHDRWAELRFAIVGPLLAAPPARGALSVLLDALSQKVWVHPATGEPVSFGAPTIERWYYQACAAGTDRVGAWRKRVRKDAGTHRAVTPALGSLLRAQYDDRRPPHVVLSLRGKLTLDRASLAKSCSAIFVKDLIFLGARTVTSADGNYNVQCAA